MPASCFSARMSRQRCCSLPIVWWHAMGSCCSQESSLPIRWHAFGVMLLIRVRIILQVKSTWDENLYTTKLDPKKVGISANEADRLAREIENSSASNRHLAEERNQNSRNTGEEVGALQQPVPLDIA